MTVKLTFRGQEKISASTPIDSATMCQEDRVPATFLSLVLTRALAVHQGFTTPRALKLSDIFRCCSRVRIAVCCAEEDAFPDKRAVQCHRLRAVLLLWQGRCTELALGSDSVPNLEEPRKPKTNGPHDRGHFNGLDRLDSENRVYAKDHGRLDRRDQVHRHWVYGSFHRSDSRLGYSSCDVLHICSLSARWHAVEIATS